MAVRTRIGAVETFAYTNDTGLGGQGGWTEMNNADGVIQVYTAGFACKYGGASWCRYGGTGASGYDDAAGADQYAKCKLKLTATGGHNRIGVAIRASTGTGAARDCYAFYAQTSDSNWTTRLAKYVDGSPTTLAELIDSTSVTWATDDTLALEVIGNTLTCYKNDVEIGSVGGQNFTYTDSSSPLGSGRPGPFASVEMTLGQFNGTEWEGGTVVAGSPPTVSRGMMLMGVG